jgi:SAM-dependent methyltransferase
VGDVLSGAPHPGMKVGRKVCLACGARFAGEGWRCPICQYEPSGNGYLSFAPDLAADGGAFDPRFFADLAETEGQSFWFRGRNALILWGLRTYFPTATSFFEIGCGTGFVLAGIRESFPRLELAGAELSAAGIAVARRRLLGVPIFQMDARRIPFEDGFDVVGAFDVLEHIDQDDEVLGQAYQAARPGGGLMLSVPQHRWLWGPADTVSGHRRRYERAELLAKLRRAGFASVRTTSFMSLLLPLMALSRLRSRRSAKAFDPFGELRLGRLTNRLLETVLDLERGMIRAGMTFPFGGSLLAVARKP